MHAGRDDIASSAVSDRSPADSPPPAQKRIACLGLDAFRHELAGVFDLEAGVGGAFSGEVRFQATRRFALLHLQASPLLFRQTMSTPPDAASIVRVRDGAIETRTGATACRLGPGGLFFLDPADTFAFRPLERAALDWTTQRAPRATWRRGCAI